MARTAGFDRTEALEKARDLFWRKGYHATSLKDLESALDLKPGSIYAAFGSKEGLFSEALLTYAETSRMQSDEIMDKASSPLAGLAAYARSLGGVCDTDVPSRACMLMKTVLEFPEGSGEIRSAAERLLSSVEARFTERFAAARDAGEIGRGTDPQRLARRFQADVIGLRAYAQRNAPPDAIRDLAEDIATGVEALRAG